MTCVLKLMGQKLLGIDYGSKRVGLATGNIEAKVASPLKTLKNDETLVARIGDICEAEGIDTIVVGLPRGLDSQETAQSWVVRQFASVLGHQLKLPVELQDEAGTSELARDRIGQAAARADKTAVDQEAAAIILQDYLENSG